MLSIAFHTAIHQANVRLQWTWPSTSVCALFNDNASEHSSNILFAKRLGLSHRVLKIVWYPKCGNQKCDSHVERRKRTSRTSPGEKHDYIWKISQLTIGEERGLVCNHLSRKVELSWWRKEPLSNQLKSNMSEYEEPFLHEHPVYPFQKHSCRD